MQPTSQQIQELRTNFLKKLNEAGGESVIHPLDLERINANNEWVRRFLLHVDCDMNEALKMMWDTCEWRNKFGTNEITEENIRIDYLIDGNFFSHGKDVDGSTLLIFKCKKHIKGQKDFEELKRCVVYWFERLEREVKGAPVTIFFDLENCGLSNLDMDFTKYLINLFKLYYPYFLNYIIIYEMAWILNAAFKIIKSLLPEKAVAKMKFVNKTTLKEYVTPDQALKCWGGEDDYVFSFVPEVKPVNNTSLVNSSPSSKKVHFADGSPMSESNIGGFGDRESNDSGILIVDPSACITFVKDGVEMSSVVTLTNSDDQLSISYKMKTTAPEKFRVRPSTGILIPGAQTTITVNLQPGFQLGGLSRDKFLVMSMTLDNPDMSVQEVADLWKNSAGKSIYQHKLKCSQSSSDIIRNGSAIGSSVSEAGDASLIQLKNNVTKLLECQGRLHNDLKSVQKLQWMCMFLIICLALVIIYILRNEIREYAPQQCYKQI